MASDRSKAGPGEAPAGRWPCPPVRSQHEREEPMTDIQTTIRTAAEERRRVIVRFRSSTGIEYEREMEERGSW